MSELTDKRFKEREKYLYIQRHSSTYFTGSHGKDAIPFIKSLEPETIADIGTAGGDMCGYLADELPTTTGIWGIDFAFAPLEHNKRVNVFFETAPAHQLPLSNKSIDVLTAFDVLEHFLPEEIDEIFEEFVRVTSKHMVFSICTCDSKSFREVLGSLHPTIQPHDWWVEKLSKFGKTKHVGKYVHVEL